MQKLKMKKFRMGERKIYEYANIELIRLEQNMVESFGEVEGFNITELKELEHLHDTISKVRYVFETKLENAKT